MYTMTRTDIANAFDVPTTLLDRKDSNLASAETGDYAHAKYAGIPRLKRNEAAMNQLLVSLTNFSSRAICRRLISSSASVTGLPSFVTGIT